MIDLVKILSYESSNVNAVIEDEHVNLFYPYFEKCMLSLYTRVILTNSILFL